MESVPLRLAFHKKPLSSCTTSSAPQKRDALAKQLLARASSAAARPGKGKIVYRNLRDGDVMLTNRQPTLHKPGMMAHRARVLKVKLMNAVMQIYICLHLILMSQRARVCVHAMHLIRSSRSLVCRTVIKSVHGTTYSDDLHACVLLHTHFACVAFGQQNGKRSGANLRLLAVNVAVPLALEASHIPYPSTGRAHDPDALCQLRNLQRRLRRR